MGVSPARLYACAGLVVCAVYALIGGNRFLAGALGLSCALAIVAAIRLHRPPAQGAWALLAISRALAAAGELTGGASSQSWTPTVLFFASDILCLLAIVLLVMTRVDLRAVGDHLDATLVTIAAGLGTWVLFLDDRSHALFANHGGLLIFTLSDLAAIWMIVRLGFDLVSRGVSYWLVVATAVAMVICDAAVVRASGAPYGPVSLPQLAWLLTFVLIGAAVLHPSMLFQTKREIAEHADAMPGPRRVIGLGLVLTSIPACVLLQDAWHGGVHIAIVAAAGTIVAAVMTVRATLLVRHLDRLRAKSEASERKFRLVFEGAPVGISIGKSGMMTETNAAAQRILGYTGAELAGLHFSDITHPDDVAAEAQQQLDSGQTTRIGMDKRYVKRDGSLVETSVSIALDLVDGLGVAIIEDVSERRDLEEQLLQSRKMEAVGKLAGGVAHDFNNLMTSVLGYSEMLVSELEGPSQNRAKIINEAAARASDLTRQLLAFSRRQMLQTSDADLRDIVADLAPRLRDTLGAEIDLRLDVTEAPVPVHADLRQLEQVVLNLAANAREAMPDGGRLTIGVSSAGGEALLAVSDTGVGIPVELRPLVFEPFFTTKRFGETAGLGLSTVDGIVAQSGGSVAVADADGGGTVFTVRLPLAA